MSSPVKFGDLGKGASDLLKKKFDYKNTLKVTRKTAAGVKVETVATSGKDNLTGKVTGSFKEKGFGEVEFSAATTNAFSGKVKLTSLMEGATVTLKSAAAKAFSCSTNMVYKAPSVTATLDAGVTESEFGYDKSVAASFVFGMDNISVGATVSADFAALEPEKEGAEEKEEVNPLKLAYSGAVSYSMDDSTITGVVNQKGEASATLLHTMCPGYKGAVKFEYPKNVLTFGSAFSIDKATLIKGAVSTEGIVNTAVEHTLSSPALKLNLACQYKTTNGLDLTAQKTGLGITLG